VELSVSRAVIARGKSVTVNWNVTGAKSVEFNLTGSVSAQGSYTDSPDKDQTYTITAYNADNVPTEKSMSVRVIETRPSPPPKPHLYVDRNVVNQGQLVLFTWSAKGAQSVRIDSYSATQLTGAYGTKQAKLNGKGKYVFAVVSANEAAETKSDPITVEVGCTRTQKLLKTCRDTPLIEWQ
jgi:hypothetical protein